MAKQSIGTGQSKRQYICEMCGTIKMQWPSQVGEHFYCSQKCYWQSMKGKEPYNKGCCEILVKTCPACGKTFSGSREKISRKLCCSRKCAGLASHSLTNDLGKNLEILSIQDPNSGCWLWLGDIRGGYGRMRVDGKLVSAHRASYEYHIGPIPDGMVLDH